MKEEPFLSLLERVKAECEESDCQVDPVCDVSSCDSLCDCSEAEDIKACKKTCMECKDPLMKACHDTCVYDADGKCQLTECTSCHSVCDPCEKGNAECKESCKTCLAEKKTCMKEAFEADPDKKECVLKCNCDYPFKMGKRKGGKGGKP